MGKKPNTYGGGVNTNINGLKFENDTLLNDALLNAGFQIRNEHDVFLNDILIGYSYRKAQFSTKFLRERKIDYTEINSKRWDPDDAFININNNTVYIIEKKFQKSSGSVDEKLATFPFKHLVYSRLLNKLNYKLEYIYLLNGEWFNTPKYADYYKYMDSLNCKYRFDVLPLSDIGLTE